ncbi:MAG: type II secretion system F family protein, partial [Verrucomicrobiota bacterium]
LFQLVVARPEGRAWWDQVKLKIPLFGPVMATRFYAGFCQALANLVVNGVPLLSGLRLMERATPNLFFRRLLTEVIASVGGGSSLSDGMRQARHFPNILVDMMAVGEQTGRLGHSLEKAALRYDKELDSRIKRLTALISPVIIIVMAVVVTIVAYSIVTAIFQSVSGIRGRA